LTDLEILSLAQRVGLEGQQVRPESSMYVATRSDEDEYALILRLTRIITYANNLIEEVHRQKFARATTEHMRSIGKGR